IASDPTLQDWVNGKFRPLYGSPAIDAGDSAVSQGSVTDFYGNPRVFAGNPGGTATVDIGAVEFEPPVVTALDGQAVIPSGITMDGVLGSSADPAEPLTFVIESPASHGSVSLIDSTTGTFQYTPALGYLGSDSFTFDVTDPYGTTSDMATEQV